MQIPEADRDTSLPDKLLVELPGILAWAVRGCLAWQQTGLLVPDAVKAATAGYRHEQDIVGAFLEERCFLHTAVRVKASALYEAYKGWCEGQGERPEVQRNFGRALTERGYTRKVNNGVWYEGIGLPAKEQPTERPTEGPEGAEPNSTLHSLEPFHEGVLPENHFRSLRSFRDAERLAWERVLAPLPAQAGAVSTPL